ncbi:ABC transporter substrate-binding protein [Achromobacter sp. GG226]|uniref:ABC transporter substrate-binding protein n=1 Tax=Verticiella alkaliphila TaxID=2779529 RepID=UPI001C0D22FA|nr:ABC transporter substrate-binding protein [Verticiella sp. GG226]MBU4612312.1 ABC transporter substrate-binding protein [Verticiella sp. GG226]
MTTPVRALSPASPLRRSLLAAAGASALGLALPRGVRAQSAGPLRIALLTSLSGPFASLGESMRAGLELLIAESGGQMGGRPVQLLVEDDHGKPDEAVRKVRKLLSQDRADVLCGIISAAVALAVRDIVSDAQVPTFVSNASANALAREAASPLIFRPTKTSWMLGHTAARWAHEHIAQQGGITLASDYAAGREYVGDFVSTYEGQGGKLSRPMWTPLGTTDFAPLLMNIAAAQPAFLYAFLPGADAVRFLQQVRDFRLQDKLRILGPGALFDQEDVLPAAGDAGLGGINTFHQSPGAPAAAGFVAAYQKVRGRLPGEASTSGYATGQVIRAALEAVDGDVARKDALKARLLEATVDTAFGPMRFDARNNQAILDIYVNDVRRGPDGKPLNTIVHTFEGVRDPGPAA